MRNTYYPPSAGAANFHCILCGVYASQDWRIMYIDAPGSLWRCAFRASKCAHCDEYTFWHKDEMIVPSTAPVEPPHSDLPSDCRPEYEEAMGVFSRSPRSAAALLRLLVQKLLPHLGERSDNINDAIKSLVAKGLSVRVQQALDYCRVVGNHAVHPGEIDLNDTPEIAQQLFSMINFIVDDRITRPKEVEALYTKLPEPARAAIEKRDARN